MREIIQISVDHIKPEMSAVFETQQIPALKKLPEKIKQLLKRANDLFLESSQPIGIIADVSISEFDTIYQGDGLNEKKTPVDEIFRKADNLALFALTMGEQISKTIEELFTSNEFALGSMLDSVASAGTDKAGDIIESHFISYLSQKGKIYSSTGVLRYSPGYCGWHMSGQEKLFAFLHPEEIGITLLDSYLMKPLKTISGVIIAGKKEIHIFEDSYPFCNQCKTHSCRKRIASLIINNNPTKSKGEI